MNANPLTATELIKKTKEELLRTGYSQLSLKLIDRVWMNLEQYLHSKGVDNFSPEVGTTFWKSGTIIQQIRSHTQTQIACEPFNCLLILRHMNES